MLIVEDFPGGASSLSNALILSQLLNKSQTQAAGAYGAQPVPYLNAPFSAGSQ